MEHALFCCEHARAVWFGSSLRYHVQENCLASMQGWWRSLLDKEEVKENRILEMAVLIC